MTCLWRPLRFAPFAGRYSQLTNQTNLLCALYFGACVGAHLLNKSGATGESQLLFFACARVALHGFPLAFSLGAFLTIASVPAPPARAPTAPPPSRDAVGRWTAKAGGNQSLPPPAYHLRPPPPARYYGLEYPQRKKQKLRLEIERKGWTHYSRAQHITHAHALPAVLFHAVRMRVTDVPSEADIKLFVLGYVCPRIVLGAGFL